MVRRLFARRQAAGVRRLCSSNPIVDVKSGKEIRHFEREAKGGCSLAFSPDGKKLASLEGSDILLRDVTTGKTLQTLKRRKDLGLGGNIVAVAYSPDGKLIAGG